MSISTIVVGIDGNPASHSALRLAIDEATLRHCRVMAVSCWSSTTRHLARRPGGSENDTFEDARTIVREAFVSVATSDSERSMIVTQTSEGEPGPALVRASLDAEFLIIGSTTRGPLARHAGKTVVDHCLRYSDIPVIVVPFAPGHLSDSEVDIELRSSAVDPAANI